MLVSEPPEGFEDLAGLELAWPSPQDSLRPRRGARVINVHPDTGINADLSRAEGFRAAAELMYRSLTGLHVDDRLVFPFANCWRHSIELQLKLLLPDLRRINLQPGEEVSVFKHSILELWRAARPLLEQTFPPDKDIRWVERLLSELTEIDPDGQHFRYASTRQGKPTLGGFTGIDVEHFHGSLMGVASFLEAATHGVWHMESELGE